MHLQWFRVPEKIYCKKSCLPFALEELETMLDRKRVMVLTDRAVRRQESFSLLADKLQTLHLDYAVYETDDTEDTEMMAHTISQFQPGCLLVFGSDRDILAAQHLWLHCAYLKLHKVCLVTVPCFVGMGSHVAHFAAESDGAGDNFFFADMTIIDTDLMSGKPEEIYCQVKHALYQAIHALDATAASDYTDSMAVQAIRLILVYLPAFLEHTGDSRALEKLAFAGTMAGIAFSNARAVFSEDVSQHVRFAELTGTDPGVFTQELEAVLRLY